MTDPRLADIRQKIDDVDDKILELLKERVHFCLQTVNLKKQTAMPGVYDLHREQFILDRLTKVDQGDLTPSMIRDIYTTIMSVCRNLQIDRYEGSPEKVLVSVMGIEGSYSEVAASQFLNQRAIENYQLIYAITSKQVVEQLMSGSVQYGVMGISNSTAGVVQETLAALSGKPCKIDSVLSIPIRHCLMALSGADNITAIYSHEQALQQCQKYLRNCFLDTNLIAYEDTALAAKHLAAGILPKDSAVIANRVCADMYGLKIIADDIVDRPNNATMFCVIRRV